MGPKPQAQPKAMKLGEEGYWKGQLPLTDIYPPYLLILKLVYYGVNCSGTSVPTAIS